MSVAHVVFSSQYVGVVQQVQSGQRKCFRDFIGGPCQGMGNSPSHFQSGTVEWLGPYSTVVSQGCCGADLQNDRDYLIASHDPGNPAPGDTFHVSSITGILFEEALFDEAFDDPPEDRQAVEQCVLRGIPSQ